MSKESYQSSEEEIKKAEEMMSEERENMEKVCDCGKISSFKETKRFDELKIFQDCRRTKDGRIVIDCHGDEEEHNRRIKIGIENEAYFSQRDERDADYDKRLGDTIRSTPPFK